MPQADTLRDAGWPVDGLARGATDDERSAPHFDQVFDATWTRSPLDLKGILPMLRRIDELVDAGAYDIVHVHTPVAAFFTRLALRRQRKRRGLKVVYTAHGFHFHRGGKPVRNAIFLAAEWIAGRWTDALIVINRDDELAARRFRIVPADRLHYMPGIGVDTTRFDRRTVPDQDTARFREEVGVNLDAPLLLCIAELIPRKRHADLIEAFSRIDNAEAQLLVAGSGPLRCALERQAIDLGVRERVHFLGHRHDVPVMIAASAAVVLVSEQEGLPRCLLEALSMETPVIATAIRGSKELVADDGELVAVGDVAGIAAAMDRVLSRLDTCRRRAARARARILGTNDQEMVLASYEALFASLIRVERTAG